MVIHSVIPALMVLRIALSLRPVWGNSEFKTNMGYIENPPVFPPTHMPKGIYVICLNLEETSV